MFWMALPILLAAGATAEPASCGTAKEAQMARYQPFYINNEAIEFGGASYTKYGLPRVLLPTDLTIVGKVYGVPVGADATAPDDREIIYLLVDGGACEFQPYQKS